MTLDQIRTVDQSQKTAAEEINRGFSALSVGADRAAARRALGIRKPRIEPEDEKPLLQSVPFLVGSLVLIAVVFAAAAFWPFGRDYQALLQQANTLLESSDNGDWRKARSLYLRIMEYSRDEDLRLEAEQQYFESRRQSMMYRLQGGAGPLEKPLIRELYAIMQTEANGQLKAAQDQYRQLIDKIDPLDDLRYVRTEAQTRLENIGQLESAAEQLRQRYEQLLVAVDSGAANEQDLADLAALKQEILDAPAAGEFLADLTDQLRRELDAGPVDAPEQPAEPPDSGGRDEDPES